MADSLVDLLLAHATSPEKSPLPGLLSALAAKPARGVSRLADYQGIINQLGPETAGSQIDARRTGTGHGYLPQLSDDELSTFDRYAQGVNLERQNPGLLGLLRRAVAVPVATAYEGAKFAPPLLNAAARIPGLETLAVDETTSKPSLSNVLALSSGAFGDVGRAVDAWLHARR